MDINEPINNSKKLNIIAIAEETASGEAAVQHGFQIARAFKASLTIFTGFSLSIDGPDGAATLAYIENAAKNCPDIEVKVISGHVFPETLFTFADNSNTAMIVAGIGDKNSIFSPKKAIKFIKNSRFPVLAVTEKPLSADCYKDVLLPLDIERQNKEKALWAGYFSRFHGSTVHVLFPEYKDEGLAKLVKDNVDFVEKLYGNLEIGYTLESYRSSGYFDETALEYAKDKGIRLSVIMMTKYYTLADIITGPRERGIVGRSDIPLLCINQRDDLYVLCT